MFHNLWDLPLMLEIKKGKPLNCTTKSFIKSLINNSNKDRNQMVENKIAI